MEYIYTFEVSVHWEGIDTYEVCASLDAARRAMRRYKAKTMNEGKEWIADARTYRGDDMVLAYQGEGEDLIIRRKDLHS